jgi:hydroxymethylbilane synthase
MSESPNRVTVGTRGSRLAIAQTESIVSGLRERFPNIEFCVKVIETEGDRNTSRPIAEIGDKGVFVRAIERALVEGSVDIAVHSLKDVPSDEETVELELAAFSTREDARDVLVSVDDTSLASLRAGSRIGTGSLRRLIQLRLMRPDVEVVEIRGNVDTRLRKLAAGEFDAVVLAAAGLVRLGLVNRVSEYLPIESFIPDAGQGILAVQVRRDDAAIKGITRVIDDPVARVAATAERAVVRALGADCRSPVGAHATVEGDAISVSAIAALDVNSPTCRAQHSGPAHDAERIGTELGNELLRAMSNKQ